MCYSYYELQTRDDGKVEVLAWRDPKEKGYTGVGNSPMHQTGIVVDDRDVAEKLVDRLNAGAIGDNRHSNGFWPKPSTKLDPCTGEAVAV